MVAERGCLKHRPLGPLEQTIMSRELVAISYVLSYEIQADRTGIARTKSAVGAEGFCMVLWVDVVAR